MTGGSRRAVPAAAEPRRLVKMLRCRQGITLFELLIAVVAGYVVISMLSVILSINDIAG